MNKLQAHGILTFGGSHYRYRGFYFEVHPRMGPIPLNKDGEPSVRNPSKLFWETWAAFKELPEEEKFVHSVWQSPGSVRF